MSNVTRFPVAPQAPGPRRHVQEMQASLHARRIADLLREVDAVLGGSVPARKSSHYDELAAQVIGQLDPTRHAAAEYRGWQKVYAELLTNGSGPHMTPAQRADVVKRAFRSGLVVYTMCLEGRLPASESDARRVDVEGKVIA